MLNLTVSQLQAAIQAAGHSWHVRTIPADEPRHGLGWEPSPSDLVAHAQQVTKKMLVAGLSFWSSLPRIDPPIPGVAAGSHPASFDWRSRGVIGDVRDQSFCGACVSFATTGLVAAMAALELGTVNLLLSEADQHFASAHGPSCEGWDALSALEEIKNRGVATDDTFPYMSAFDRSDNGSSVKIYSRNEPNRAFRTYRLTDYSLWVGDARKDYLAFVGPLVASFSVYEDFQGTTLGYGGGVYRYTTGEYVGGHCVLVIGYSDTEQAWICRNSWGAGWAGPAQADGTGAGFFKIGYGECGIDDHFFFGCHGIIPPDQLPVITAVAPVPDYIDAFAVGTDHSFCRTHAQLAVNTDWSMSWKGMRGGLAAPGTAIYGALQKDAVHIFGINTDRQVCTTNLAGGKGWLPWGPLPGGVGVINTMVAAPHTSVTVTTDTLYTMSVFCVSEDYRVMTTYRVPNTTQWDNWQPLGTLQVAPNTTVYGVSHNFMGNISVFAVGADYRVYTLLGATGPSIRSAQWHPVSDLRVAPNTSVYGVSRNMGYVDIFAVGADLGIYTAALSPDNASWQGWWRIASGTAAPNTSVFAASRSTDKLDVFAVGADHGIYTAAWTPDNTGWQGWWRIANGTAAPGTSVFGISPSPDRLDVFAIDSKFGTCATNWQPAQGWQAWQRMGGGLAEGD